ncbi:MAG: polysaccharide biosynthesis/export family protein [Gemmataceae bacterium]|nr:polysaccharide biosynthesis/export family protein [Gemmataceae bacterium]MCI0739785.1 polysaccharide biosynthesis/export family protein [Gemmataceae bacterium]
MKPGKPWSPWQCVAVGELFCCAFAALFISGCALGRAKVEGQLMADKNSTTRNQGVLEHYHVGFPDILAIEVAGKKALTGHYLVGVDGSIELAEYGKLRVDGSTPGEVARLISKEIGIAQRDVRVGVEEYRSQVVFLFGQVIGWQRAVPYQGQETVLDLLQRVGGIAPGAEPDEVFVVRTHLEDGKRQEVFHVHLRSIVLKKDESSNVRLLPYDQIFVGETRQARVERCIPPWFRPVYQAIWKTNP